MPYTEVMPKFGKGELHSGSKSGPKVTNPKQAVAIMYSEKRAGEGGKKEYQAHHHHMAHDHLRHAHDHLAKAMGTVGDPYGDPGDGF